MSTPAKRLTVGALALIAAVAVLIVVGLPGRTSISEAAAPTPGPTATEPGPSGSDPSGPGPVLPRHHLLLGPVPGLTTVWHPAPEHTAVPSGITLYFKRFLEPGTTATWIGADEVQGEPHWSTAECRLDTPGPVAVTLVRKRPGGPEVREHCLLEVVAASATQVRVGPVQARVEPVRLDPTRLNASAYRAFKSGSIAALTRLGEDRFLTSVGRSLRLEAAVEPAGFAPLIEWRPLRAAPEAAYHLGSSLQLSYGEPGVRAFSVGPPADPRRVEVETYSARITSHRSNRDLVPEGYPVTFTAETDPPGHEAHVTWLAATSHGRAEPLQGRGPSFTVRFADTFAGRDLLSGEPWQWLGVRADNAVFNQDPKLEMDCFESEAPALALILDPAVPADQQLCGEARTSCEETGACDPVVQPCGCLNLDSKGLTDSKVNRFPPGAGGDVATELVQLELATFIEGLGHVIVRERGDRASSGQLTKGDAPAGEFASGSFDVHVEIELVEMQTILTTGDQPASVATKPGQTVTQLPPIGQEYESPGDPLPVFNQQNMQVGWLCHNKHIPTRQVPCDRDSRTSQGDRDCFSSSGQVTVIPDPDAFDLALFDADLIPDPQIQQTCDAQGVSLSLTSDPQAPARVNLDPSPYEAEPNSNQAKEDIQTELVQLELLGDGGPLGPVRVSESASRRSRGAVADVTLKNVQNGFGEFDSGTSFFDIFVDVHIGAPGSQLWLHSGRWAIRLETGTITALPPLGGDGYVPPPQEPQLVPLFDGLALWGWLCHAQHIPLAEEDCP